MISLAFAVSVAAVTLIGCLIAPRVLDRIHDGSVLKVCAKVSVGMSHAELNELLHRHNSYTFESIRRGTNEYLYTGNDGTCVVALDPNSGKVLTNRSFPGVKTADY